MRLNYALKNQTKYIYLIFGLLLINSTSFSQDNSKIIQEIRQKVTAINTTKFPVIRKIDDAEEFLGQATDNGGELIGYIKNDTVCKIHESVGLSDGFFDTDYYLEKEKVIFAYVVEKRFSHQNDGTVDYSKQRISFEGRYYYNSERLIKKTETGERRFSDEKLPLLLIDDSRKYAAMLKQKKSQHSQHGAKNH